MAVPNSNQKRPAGTRSVRTSRTLDQVLSDMIAGKEVSTVEREAAEFATAPTLEIKIKFGIPLNAADIAHLNALTQPCINIGSDGKPVDSVECTLCKTPCYG